ncbi:hypothetical protein K438DRAFT_1992258 [Mycena galopus ATCC 62051]|nr:hypothetical protein K438DRAFT_1992258 [Mycena galopus ATCC 62051]
MSFTSLRAQFDAQCSLIATLTAANVRLEAYALTRTATIVTMKKLRAERKAWRIKALRTQTSLTEVRHELAQLRTWNAKTGHMYSAQTRRLVLRISQAGCPEAKIKDVILSCADVFGINVNNLTISARTVARIKKEGGLLSLIQIGREITLMYGFTESSDGTSHRKTNLECRSLSGMLPTYSPDIDDENPHTWKPQTRQVDGTKLLAAKIAAVTTNTPSSVAAGITMDWREWFRKQIAQMSDHAADQARKHELTAELKHEIVIEDLGVQELESRSIVELLDALLLISDEEVQEKSGKPYDELTPTERAAIVKDLVNAQLGEETYELLSDDLKAVADFLIFGGCCGHKDTNAFKGGCRAMAEAWPRGEQPVLLANKANDTTIRLGDASSAAVRAAEDASTRGAVKAMSLLGALFRHKDENKGYQDRYLMFMTHLKREYTRPAKCDVK